MDDFKTEVNPIKAKNTRKIIFLEYWCILENQYLGMSLRIPIPTLAPDRVWLEAPPVHQCTRPSFQFTVAPMGFGGKGKGGGSGSSAQNLQTPRPE